MGCGSSTEGSDPGQRPHDHNHQQNHQQQDNINNESPIKVKKVKMDKKILENYLKLEKKLHTFESQNVIKGLKVKKEQLEDLEATCKQLDDHHNECVRQTAKEKEDVDKMPSIRSFFTDQTQYDAKMTKEQEEYLEALNKQEIAKRELDGVLKQKEQISKEVKALQGEVDKINKVYKEQDEMLASIFNGSYGSELEYNLEMELDLLQDRKTRIGIAKYKWTNARVLLQYAVNQLAHAVKKWAELKEVRPDIKYAMATETRNNLVAAAQNITSAQRYLNTIQFPYCKPEEIDTLTRATNNIYTDMQQADRHEHAMNCYGTTHKRAAALLQWFDNVIKNTICKDLEKATESANEKEKQLRAERLRLIKEKIRETQGNDVNLDVDNEMDLGDEKESQLQTMAVDAESKTVAGTAEMKKEQGGGNENPEGESPLSDSELAPPPNEDDIFADIAVLKQKHEKELQEFQKAQEVNKTRMEAGLEEKLRARRSRRQRLEAQEQNQQAEE